MADLTDVVNALVATLQTGMAGTTIAGRIYAFTMDAPSPPAAIVVPAASDFVTYDRTLDGCDDFSLTVKVLMGNMDERTGTAELASYFHRTGPSLYTAIRADPTLGGVVAFATPTQGTAFGDVEWAGTVMFGAELSVEGST